MRDLVRPAFPDDDGSADPALAAALPAHADGRLDAGELLDRLAAARLLVPVVAVGEEGKEVKEKKEKREEREQASHMAAVLTTGRDGRTGLLAFTGLDSMARWDPAARPVAVTGCDAARAALAEGAEALVLDLAGPIVVAIERPELDLLAAGLPEA